MQCSPRIVEEKIWEIQAFFEFHKRFKDGRENVEDEERSDRPRSYITDEYVQSLVHSELWLCN
jgi:hypothetical protein